MAFCTTQELIGDHEALLRRSAAGLSSCREVLALVKERAAIEEAYGNALLRQGRGVVGLQERGTCRMGLIAFKSKTESLGRRHLALAHEFSASTTALTYLRDRLAGSHKSLAAEGSGAVREAKASLAALQRSRTRHDRAAREVGTHARAQQQRHERRRQPETNGGDGAAAGAHNSSSVAAAAAAPGTPAAAPGTPAAAPAAATAPTAAAAAAAATAPAMPATPAAAAVVAAGSAAAEDAASAGVQQALLSEVEGSSGALNESVRVHQEVVRSMAASIPKMVADFEKVEGQRIDSLKIALKKLLSAQEAMVDTTRPLLYAAADIVDAIDHVEDVHEFREAALSHAKHAGEITGLVEEQARQLRRYVSSSSSAALAAAAGSGGGMGGGGGVGGGGGGGGGGGDGGDDGGGRDNGGQPGPETPGTVGTPRRPTPSAASSLVASTLGRATATIRPPATDPHLQAMDRAAKVTRDFLALSSGEAFAEGLEVVEEATGRAYLVQNAGELALNRVYLTPSGNRLERRSETELLLERDTKVVIAPPPDVTGADGARAAGRSGLAGVSEAVEEQRQQQLEAAAAFTRSARLERGMSVVLKVHLTPRGGGEAAGTTQAAADGAASNGSGDGAAAATACETLELHVRGKEGGEEGSGAIIAAVSSEGASGGEEAAATSEHAELWCSAPVFVAIASGLLSVGAAVLTRQARAVNLAALLRLASVWQREHFITFAAAREYARKHGRVLPGGGMAATGSSGGSGGGGGDGDGSGSGGGTSRSSSSSSPTHATRADGEAGSGARTEELGKLGVDEELVRLAKQQMRRLAEEGSAGVGGGAQGSDAGGGAGGVVGGYVWSALSAVSSEATRNALWSNMKTLRSGLRGGLMAGGGGFARGGGEAGPSASDAAEDAKHELNVGEELLGYLGGDSELAQGFAFLPHAFLGCDWSGHVHVTVAHERGVHKLTLAVQPEAARLLPGLSSSVAPILTVTARRDVLLDVLGGQLDATRAVITGRVQVSDLTKLLLFKSAFRFKRAVFEAFKNEQMAKETPAAAARLDVRARLDASPPGEDVQAELAKLAAAGDEALADALLFATYVYRGPEWSGVDVVFVVRGAASGSGTANGSVAAAGSPGAPGGGEGLPILFALTQSGVKLKVGATTRDAGTTPTCTAHCERQALVDVLSGASELTAALMGGQMQSDSYTSMMAFKRAFQFDPAAWEDFGLWKQAKARGAADAAVAAAVQASQAAAAPESAVTVGTDGTPPVESEAGSSGGPADAERLGEAEQAASAEEAPVVRTAPGIERLSDDPELYTAVSYLPHAFEESSMEIGLLCNLTHEGVKRTVGVYVDAEGVRIYADETAPEMAVTCNITCERELLMQIIRGELDATNAIMGGLVEVDDLGMLMAFKMAFNLKRELFDAFLKLHRPAMTGGQ